MDGTTDVFANEVTTAYPTHTKRESFALSINDYKDYESLKLKVRSLKLPSIRLHYATVDKDLLLDF